MNKKKTKILYVEDDETLSFITKDNLERRGYDITCCHDGSEAISIFRKGTYQLCILDIMLPKMDGFSLAQSIRKINKNIPIIFLTAKSMSEDRIKGLTIGGDDYITKPFSIDELVLKIEIFLKRSIVYARKDDDTTIYKFGKCEFNYKKMILIVDDVQKKLTLKEAELLRFFCVNKGRTLTRSDILTMVWGEDDYFTGRSLDVFVSRLRKYLKDDDSIKIENLHGIGFVFNIVD